MKFNEILLVEDSQNDIELTLSALSEFDLSDRTVIVRDGVEAIEYLEYRGIYKDRKESTPFVILLDIKMPRMDGIEVLEYMKQKKELKKIPVIMLTSSNEDLDIQRAHDFGVNAYVVKPVEYHQFVRILVNLGLLQPEVNELPLQANSK
ncbi:MAG: response regulator [Bacteroidales bacterium]|nr:response regulator [Bacteroidales bacterium]